MNGWTGGPAASGPIMVLHFHDGQLPRPNVCLSQRLQRKVNHPSVCVGVVQDKRPSEGLLPLCFAGLPPYGVLWVRRMWA